MRSLAYRAAALALLLTPAAAFAQGTTASNPPGTAVSRTFDRAAGTDTSGAYPSQADGTAENPKGTMVSRAAHRTRSSIHRVAHRTQTLKNNSVSRTLDRTAGTDNSGAYPAQADGNARQSEGHRRQPRSRHDQHQVARSRSAGPGPALRSGGEDTAMPTPSRFIPGFDLHEFDGDGACIHAAVGGSGPPLLLLHGHPQTHVTWLKIAPRLAERFTVVAADLRGYGDSGKPEGGEGHVNYSKRAMAADQVAVMRHFGFDRFCRGRA